MTWDSINCAYIRLYFAVGGPRVISTMHALGVKGKLDNVYSFAVGGNEISTRLIGFLLIIAAARSR